MEKPKSASAQFKELLTELNVNGIMEVVKVGDIVTVKTPRKEDEYKIKILSIEFSPAVK